MDRGRLPPLRHPALVVATTICLATAIWLVAVALGWEDATAVGWVPATSWAAAFVIVTLLAADTVLPLPGTVLLLASGAVLGPLVGSIVNAVGLTVGAGAGYLVGAAFGARRPPPVRTLSGWTVAASRGVPLLSESIAIAAGVVAMPRRQFASASITGAVAVGTVYGVAGAIAGDRWVVVPSALLVALAVHFVVRRVVTP